MKLWVP